MDLAKHYAMPEERPENVVRVAFKTLEAGGLEILVDQNSQAVKPSLSGGETRLHGSSRHLPSFHAGVRSDAGGRDHRARSDRAPAVRHRRGRGVRVRRDGPRTKGCAAGKS